MTVMVAVVALEVEVVMAGMGGRGVREVPPPIGQESGEGEAMEGMVEEEAMAEMVVMGVEVATA